MRNIKRIGFGIGAVVFALYAVMTASDLVHRLGVWRKGQYPAGNDALDQLPQVLGELFFLLLGITLLAAGLWFSALGRRTRVPLPVPHRTRSKYLFWGQRLRGRASLQGRGGVSAGAGRARKRRA